MVSRNMFVLVCAAVSVAGHGYVESPPSRNFGCRTGLNGGCGGAQYEPQSVEGADGWPSGGPSGGTVAAAGGRFTQLNAQSPTRWGKTALAAGTHVFTWKFTAAHRTRDFKYYITRVGWNQNTPLGRGSFESSPFCVVDGQMEIPPSSVSHSCTVPTRSGYHVVLAMWDVGDTPATFYNAIDVTIGGGVGVPVPPTPPTPPTRVPVPPTPPTPPTRVPVVPTSPTPPVPTTPRTRSPRGCRRTIPEWGDCRSAESCCAAGLSCTGNRWWKSCKK